MILMILMSTAGAAILMYLEAGAVAALRVVVAPAGHRALVRRPPGAGILL